VPPDSVVAFLITRIHELAAGDAARDLLLRFEKLIDVDLVYDLMGGDPQAGGAISLFSNCLTADRKT
jgi:hypothetical protein